MNGLYTACEKGFIEIVQLLLAEGIKINTFSIYCAAKFGQYEIVKLSLDYPELDPLTDTIVIAAKNNYYDIVKLILEKRPNITLTNFKPDNDIDKKIISIYHELYPLPAVEVSAPTVEIPAVEIPKSPIVSNNNECLNDLLKKLRQEMTKQNIFKISITSNSIMVTNDLKI